MLTIRKIQTEVGDLAGALAAARYVLEPGDSPQSFDREGEGGIERGNSMWIGSEAALGQFGLERGAAVDEEALAAVMQGLHAETGAEVRVAGHVPRLVNGEKVIGADGKVVRKPVVNTYDLTFSAPKSVSVVWALAGNERRAELERAMLEAANAAVEHVVKTRPVIDGKAPAQDFVASLTLHATARAAKDDLAPMPQLHVHIDLLGVVDGAGAMRAPDNAMLYKHSAMREGGAVGRAVLADRARGLGYGVEAGSGRGGRYFEIAGVDEGLAEKMSSRSREVRAWIAQRIAEQGGPLSNRAAARAALATRGGKSHELSPGFVRSVWEALGQEFLVGKDEVEALGHGTEPLADVAALERQLRETVLRRIRAEGPTVSVGAARSIAFEAAPIGLSLEQAGRVLEELQREGELIAVGDWRVTTREIREQETQVRDVVLKAAAEKGRAPGREAVDAGVRTAERSGGFTLDPEQAEAVERLCDGFGWACLTGRAGTGKGPVLEAVAVAHRAEGWQLVAAAVDGATAGRLADQIAGEAVTIEQLLYRLEHEQVVLDEDTLVVIEEASKVGLGHWHRLAQLRERYGIRVLAVGDIQQIGAIECPGMLDVMLGLGERITVAELNEVRRHCDPLDPSKDHPWLKDVANDLYDGESETAIQRLREVGALEMKATREEALEALVERWERQRSEHGIEARDAILVVDGSNAEIDTVNRMAQERRYRAGEVRGEGVMAVDRDYRLHEGDVVMLRESSYRVTRGAAPGEPRRIENGTLGVVSAVDVPGDRVKVNFQLPGKRTREVWIEIGELRARAAAAGPAGGERVASLRLAYAGHPFPVQGGTWRYVGVMLGHWSQRKEEAYVAISRAKEYLDAFTDRESCGLQGDDEDRFRRLAKRLKRPWHRLASITYEVSPEAEIFAGVPEFEALPALPGSPGVSSPGPLRSYDLVLGPRRFGAVEAEIEAVAAEMRARGTESLRAEQAAGRRAVDLLDPAAALEVGRIERDLAQVAERIDAARETAAEMEAGAERVRGLRGRRQRAELLRAAEASGAAADQEEATLAELRERELELRDEGRHPEDWVRDHGERYARGLAAERELAARGELDQAREIDLGHDLGPELGGIEPGG